MQNSALCSPKHLTEVTLLLEMDASAIEWAGFTCLTHNEMSSFVSVAVGVLFCTSFWEKPKEFVKTIATSKYEAFQDNPFKEGKSGKEKYKLNSIVGIEYIYKEVKASIDDLGNKLDDLYRSIYIPHATAAAIAGAFFLFLGISSAVGIWNLLLLYPIGIYLFFCCREYWRFRTKVKKWREDLAASQRVQDCINQRQQSASEDTSDLKEELSSKKQSPLLPPSRGGFADSHFRLATKKKTGSKP